MMTVSEADADELQKAAWNDVTQDKRMYLRRMCRVFVLANITQSSQQPQSEQYSYS